VLSACANPLNRATFNRYRQQGIAAEAQSDWPAAEKAYYRAAENVKWGHLGDELESDSLYNLGRIKRVVGKLDESEDLLRRAITIDEKLHGKEGFLTSYSLLELAETYYQLKKYNEGLELLNRIGPIALQNQKQYSPQSKTFLKEVFERYQEVLSKEGRVTEAANLKKVSDSLK
jgi:tetratricopeptide (TPR) repeat protein